MPRPYTPYIPQTISEIWDLLGGMMLEAPTFVDKTGYFPQQNIDTEFFALKEGLKSVQKKLGEERYERLVVMADRMKAHFLADPEDKTEDSVAGRRLINEMEGVLKEVWGSRKS